MTDEKLYFLCGVLCGCTGLFLFAFGKSAYGMTAALVGFVFVVFSYACYLQERKSAGSNEA